MNTKVFVRYDRQSLKVLGLYLEHELSKEEHYIEITKEEERKMLRMANEQCGSLYVKDVNKKVFETKSEPNKVNPYAVKEDRITALEKEVSELKEMIKKLIEK